MCLPLLRSLFLHVASSCRLVSLHFILQDSLELLSQGRAGGNELPQLLIIWEVIFSLTFEGVFLLDIGFFIDCSFSFEHLDYVSPLASGLQNSDEMSANNLTEDSVCDKSPLSSCFQDFILVSDLRPFDYHMFECGSLLIHTNGVC